MENEIIWLQQAFMFKFGTLVGIGVWQAGLRLTLGLFNKTIQEWMEQALPAENEKLQRVMQSFWWRLVMFLCDKLLSFKLPAKGLKASAEDTENLIK